MTSAKMVPSIEHERPRGDEGRVVAVPEREDELRRYHQGGTCSSKAPHTGASRAAPVPGYFVCGTSSVPSSTTVLPGWVTAGEGSAVT